MKTPPSKLYTRQGYNFPGATPDLEHEALPKSHAASSTGRHKANREANVSASPLAVIGWSKGQPAAPVAAQYRQA